MLQKIQSKIRKIKQTQFQLPNYRDEIAPYLSGVFRHGTVKSKIILKK